MTRADMIAYTDLHMLSPIFNYAMRIQELKLNDTEAALLAAILSLQSSKPGLREPERIDLYQDAIMNVSLRYANTRSGDGLRWLKSLLRTPPLRGLTTTVDTRQGEKTICISVDNIGSLPRILLHLFEENI